MVLAMPIDPARNAPDHDPDYPRVIDVTPDPDR
jgi:hypothetical protein